MNFLMQYNNEGGRVRRNMSDLSKIPVDFGFIWLSLFCNIVLMPIFSHTVEFAYNGFGYNDSRQQRHFFFGPGRIPIFYVHSSSTTTTSAMSSLRL